MQEMRSLISITSFNLCEINTTDFPSAFRLFRISNKRLASCGVSTAVGSSRIMISAPRARILIISTLCASPTEICEIFFACVPLSVPALYYAHSESVGINFLSHDYLPSLISSRITVMWLVRFKIAWPLPLETGFILLREGPPSAKISAI